MASDVGSFVERWKQEEDEFDKGIMLHQHLIAMGDDEMLWDPLNCIEPESFYTNSYDKTLQCLETKCGIESEESKAWASYYMGEVKAWTSYFVYHSHGKDLEEDKESAYDNDDDNDEIQGDGKNMEKTKALVSYRANKIREHGKIVLEGINLVEHSGSNQINREHLLEVIDLFEQSLAEAKSCKLRYLASWKLGEFYGIIMKPLQEIRCYRIQLQEAEATGWMRAKVCALFNLCGALCLCGHFEEAIRIKEELEIIGSHDPFTMGLSFHCQGQIAYVMGNFEKCIEANSNAIDILANTEISGVFEHLGMSAISEAIDQIEKAGQGHGIFGNIEIGTNVLSLLALLKEEDDEFEKSIIRHQCAIAGRDVELVEGAIQMFLISWVECNTGMFEKLEQIATEGNPWAIHQPMPILERVMRCLESQCRVEAEESRAWALYYVGELLQLQENFGAQGEPNLPDPIDMFQQSLHGKSSTVRYLASSSLADIYSRRINYVEESRYRKIQLQAAEATTWKRAKVYALYLLCIALCRIPQFVEAIRFQEELTIMGCDDSLAQGLSHHCQGMIADSMGNFDESIQAHRKAIATLGELEFAEIKDDISGVWIPISLAKYLTIGAIADARSSVCPAESKKCERQLQRQEKQIVGMLSPSFGAHTVKLVMEIHTYWLLLAQGEMHLKNSNFDKAEAIALKLLEISQRSHEANLYARALMFRAEIANRRCPKNEDIIESFFLEAEKLVSTNLTNGDLQIVIRMEAHLYFSMHKYEKAIEKFQVCLGMFMEVEENFEYHSQGRICYLETMKSCFGKMQASILYLPRMSSSPINIDSIEMSLDNMQSTSFFLEGNQVKDALIWAERERARDLLYSIQNRLHQDAYLNNLSTFDKSDVEAWSELQSVCSLVGQDTVFLVFTIIGHIFYTYYFHAGKEPIVNVTMNTLEQDYASDVPGLLEATTSIRNEDTDGWQTYLRYLFNICIRPFKKRLKDAAIKKLIIVPNGEISLVPFAALIDDEDGQFLVQKYEISIISSLRLFKHCELRRQHLTQLSKDHNHSALVVGNPTKDLPDAEKEAEIVTNILKDAGMNTNVLIKEAATTQAVLGFLHSSFWIHMACHATVEGKVPNGALILSKIEVPDIACKDAALVLSSNDSYNDCRDIKNVDKTPLENHLTAEKIASGNQLRAVVTVLSACNSGKGQVCAEGTLSLTRSLHLAGVPTVVASTWKVDDQATTEFMKRFYTNIQQHQDFQLASALRITMVSMIEEMDDKNRPRYQPLHWAPFFISGSPSFRLSHERN